MPSSPSSCEKPRVAVSACLGFRACRYDGAILDCPTLSSLAGRVEFVPVCPEEGIGLGTPRPPIRIVRNGGGERLIQPSTGRDLGGRIEDFAEGFLAREGALDGFVVKSRSPSCALRDTKIHSSLHDETQVDRGEGWFARRVRTLRPHLPRIEETDLEIPPALEDFLIEVGLLSWLRRLRPGDGKKGIAAHRAEAQPYLARRNPRGNSELERLRKEHRTLGDEAFLDLYRTVFLRVFTEVRKEPPRS